MSNQDKYVITGALATLCIFGAFYGYISRNPLLLFSCVLVGLGLGLVNQYYKLKPDHKDPDQIAVETLARLNKKR